MNQQTPNSIKIYNAAKNLLDTQVAADNAADGNGSLACAECVNAVVNDALGSPAGGGNSTTELAVALQDTTRWTPIYFENALPGDIIISPTGQGTNPAQHGHTGIVGKYGILSNNSENGMFEEIWTLPVWWGCFVEVLGFPALIYRAK